MPPVKARPPKAFGQLTAAEEVEGNFGIQYRITLKQANPEATNDRWFFFPASDETKSKWMKFVASLVRFIGELNTSDDMLMRWVEITELAGQPFKGQDGEMHEVTQPTVTAVFADEAECRAAFFKFQAERGANAPAPVVPAAPAPAKPVVDPATIPMLRTMYANAANEEAFKQAIKAFGFGDPDAVLKLIKG